LKGASGHTILMTLAILGPIAASGLIPGSSDIEPRVHSRVKVRPGLYLFPPLAKEPLVTMCRRKLLPSTLLLALTSVWPGSWPYLTFAQEATPPHLPAEAMVPIWPALAPGESSRGMGEALPPRSTDQPPITRVEKVRCPSLDIYPAAQPQGTGIVILPGGGFGKVVPDLEGSEAAVRLNRLGITAFVLRYRTNESKPVDEPSFLRPLQDAERAVRWVRHHADRWKLQADRIGVMGFSAGGQVACLLHTRGAEAAYAAQDGMDQLPFRPDFSLLIYPWNIQEKATGKLLPELTFHPSQPPAFIVHTSDDASTSAGAARFYLGLKENNVPAELHIYENGGHGYGTRPRPDSNIGTWPDRAEDWLLRRKLGSPAPGS
jgi:acetyl esterase/lipase